MKIIKARNPLLHVVELDDNDRKILRLAIKCEELQDKLFSVRYHLAHDGLGKTKEEFLRDSADTENLDTLVDQLAIMYENELQGMHIGGCTCHASTCLKCRAEELLGINTLEGTTRSERIRWTK